MRLFIYALLAYVALLGVALLVLSGRHPDAVPRTYTRACANGNSETVYVWKIARLLHLTRVQALAVAQAETTASCQGN